MKRYKFLIKPLFYIFSLTASSYMVLVIEKISPSDFGKHKALFEATPVNQMVKFDYSKEYLKNICFDYKYGIIDSETLEERLSVFLYGVKSEPKPVPQMATVRDHNNKILLQRINE
jgi:hypothetical protein